MQTHSKRIKDQPQKTRGLDFLTLRFSQPFMRTLCAEPKLEVGVNSRLIPITTAIVSLAVAVFFIVYFDSLWRWVIASPVLVFVTWPSIKIG
ncbi:hypothetical protein [Methyloprofundus sp.]|uniref:hypothetical protein n=1 Tax=Methyloprofundus sp. TaxID=2020875 RepID=UPI003D0E0699